MPYPYTTAKNEKDYPIISNHFGSRSNFYILRSFKKGMPYYQSEIFQVLIFDHEAYLPVI